jgi:hypothetical protein
LGLLAYFISWEKGCVAEERGSAFKRYFPKSDGNPPLLYYASHRTYIGDGNCAFSFKMPFSNICQLAKANGFSELSNTNGKKDLVVDACSNILNSYHITNSLVTTQSVWLFWEVRKYECDLFVNKGQDTATVICIGVLPLGNQASQTTE